jgi:predicted acetyltransferase
VTDNETGGITIDVPTDDDWDAFAANLISAFAATGGADEIAAERLCFEIERALVARRDGEIVGTAGIYTRRLAVPGGVIPAGHVTQVSVDPTARRQGILTRFMRRQFTDIAAAGEAIAVLWASEGRIYQRFGYGLAALKLSLTASTREASLAPAGPAGALRQASPDQLRDQLAKIYDEAYGQRPGWSSRGSAEWDYRLVDLESNRNGATALRGVVHTGPDGTDGYALYRVQNRWSGDGPDGVVKIRELVATTPVAYRTLWRFLLDIDLTRSAEMWACATDEPLLSMINEPTRLAPKLSDALWLRIIDLPAALAARRYATDVDVVLEVTDEQIPANAGRWRLRGSPTAATCEATTDEADLRLDVRFLAAAYLGRESLTALAAGGLVDELRRGALAAAGTAFRWHRAPCSIEVF